MLELEQLKLEQLEQLKIKQLEQLKIKQHEQLKIKQHEQLKLKFKSRLFVSLPQRGCREVVRYEYFVGIIPVFFQLFQTFSKKNYKSHFM